MIRTESDAYAPNAVKKSAVARVRGAKPIRALVHTKEHTIAQRRVTAGNVMTRRAHRGPVNLRCDANVRVATRGSVGLVGMVGNSAYLKRNFEVPNRFLLLPAFVGEAIRQCDFGLFWKAVFTRSTASIFRKLMRRELPAHREKIVRNARTSEEAPSCDATTGSRLHKLSMAMSEKSGWSKEEVIPKTVSRHAGSFL